MPIRHSVLAALFFTVLALPALPAFATGGGKRYEQVGEHYDVSINYPVLQHPAADADIVRIVWKLTDAFRRVAGHGLPQQSAAAPNPRQDDGTAGADTPGPTGASNPPHGVVPDGAAQGAPRADADVYTPARRDWLTATHRISRPSANAVSVVFEVQTGLWGRDGAAVSLDLLAVSYDLAAGRRIELDDLFGDDDCADAVLTTHLRRWNGGNPSAVPSAVSGAPRPADNGGSETSQGNAETQVTFWLTPRGLMLLPGSCCWQTVSAGGSSSVPGNFLVDARSTPAAPSSAVEVPIEPLLHCAPHLSYWGRVR